MIRRISASLGQVHPGAYYLASAVVLSLAANTFTEAYGAVPAPPNQLSLLLCALAAFVSAVALSTLGWRIETIRQLAMERSADVGLPSRHLIGEATQAFFVEVFAKMTVGVVTAIMSIVFMLGRW
ncbi:hypothetical protein [Nocardia brasiliensis]|uniref:hypothetical protein n=1 Tax=Nocardia brasiliensis TaxID=37326 RepID=UPI0004A749F6|nr:hypothetical protein [Nocardia brasiliensis]MBF6129692.1 hypothetical protein [Nocardia brasiliensis]MBF6541420.1 hypothetical protein [Nocardia brasiliensis]